MPRSVSPLFGPLVRTASIRFGLVVGSSLWVPSIVSPPSVSVYLSPAGRRRREVHADRGRGDDRGHPQARPDDQAEADRRGADQGAEQGGDAPRHLPVERGLVPRLLRRPGAGPAGGTQGRRRPGPAGVRLQAGEEEGVTPGRLIQLPLLLAEC